MRPPIIEFRAITKRFGSVIANDEVSFSISPHTIHGVIGENGAGKSTIMKCLYGMYQPDEGEILLSGTPVKITSPHKAIQQGIGMVHQHFMLIRSLSVWENIILGLEKGPVLKKKRTILELQALQEKFGFRLNLNAITCDLSVGQEQQVEILKLLYRNASILIFDEPTAVLTPHEVQLLFKQMKELVASGKTIILITHKLKEVLATTEKITLMRKGRVVTTCNTCELNEQKLSEQFIGKQGSMHTFTSAQPRGTVFRVSHVGLTKRKRTILSDLNFTVRGGEILAVAGVSGNGQQDLINVLCRLSDWSEGKIFFDGKDFSKETIFSAREKGLAIIPPDRLRESIISDFSLEENLILGHHHRKEYQRSFFLSRMAIRNEAMRLINDFEIHPSSPKIAIGKLSGGNQQKSVVARETSLSIKLLVAAYPTRGVDFGAMQFIHNLFLKLKREGVAIILFSTEIDEIRAISDRIIVLFNGRIIKEVQTFEATDSLLGAWMAGVSYVPGA